jgi:hypothetical protein
LSLIGAGAMLFGMALVFDQKPWLQDGWLTWSVKDNGGASIAAGTAIGEWEMWDAADITRTVIPRETVTAKEDVAGDDVAWAQVWVQMAPEPGFSGQGKLVIQVGTDIADVEYDWTALSADASAFTSPAAGAETLVFAEAPAHSSGALQWCVRNTGELVVRAGTPIGEFEIVDTDNLTSTIVQRQVVEASSDLLPDEVGWTPRIELAPLTPAPGWFTIVVQLGTEIVSVDYLMADGRVVE